MKKLEIDTTEGKQSGWVQIINGKLWAHLNGKILTFEPIAKSSRRGTSQTKKSGGGVFAPMPGKVTRIQIVVGDKVEANQMLLVMEAMKMEYVLKAPTSGLIKEVMCVVGQQVSLGQELVKVIAAASPEA